MVATTFAADTPLAVAELVGKYGISGNWLWWSFLTGGMVTVFFFAGMWRRSGILTEAEFIEFRYSGKPAAFLRGFKAAYLGLFMNVLIIGWVNLAMMKLLAGFFGISHGDAFLYTGAAMVFVAVYSSMAGLLGVVYTDAVQFIIAMAGCIMLAVVVVGSDQIGGIDNLVKALPEGSMDFFPRFPGDAAAALMTISGGAFVAHLAFQWWASWYPGAEPGGGGYIAQRMMSAKNEKNAVLATLFFQVAHYCLRPWPWIIVGLCGLVLYPAETDKGMTYVMTMRDFLPPGLKGLMLAAFFGAYMSTISTQLNWGASYLVNDIYLRFLKPGAGQKELVLSSRIATVALMIIGLGVTSRLESIAEVWKFIIECGAGLGLVLMLRWYWRRINVWSEITATVAPFIYYYIANYLLGYVFPGSFFFTVAGTTGTWLLVTFLTPAEPAGKLSHFFSTAHNPAASKSALIFCCLGAIVMTYGILFASGKFILHQWNDAVIASLFAAAGTVLFVYFFRRSGFAR